MPVGASHAIGHFLGAYGVPHGHTTGVCLPAVLRWNLKSNSSRQALAADAVGTTAEGLADALLILATELGVPYDYGTSASLGRNSTISPLNHSMIHR